MDRPRSILTPGNFDGVHRGHQSLVRHAQQRAQQCGAQSVALFFSPHPAQLFRPEQAPALLTTPERRSALLKAAGIDVVDCQSFDRQFASLSPEAFVDEVLVDRHRCRQLFVGPDFRFGKGRAGDASTLRELGKTRDFEVETLDFVEDGEPISSTRIRGLLADGHVADAARLLDRHHDVDGTVVVGHRRGRALGFPTANLDCEHTQLPSDGVYALWVKVDDAIFPAVANLGERPTFKAGRSVEAHLLGFEGDLYGKRLRVAFVSRLRGERRFDGLEALKAQIQRDVVHGQDALAAAPKEWRRWM